MSDLLWQPFYTSTQFINVLKIPTFKQQHTSRGVKVGSHVSLLHNKHLISGYTSRMRAVWSRKTGTPTGIFGVLCACAVGGSRATLSRYKVCKSFSLKGDQRTGAASRISARQTWGTSRLTLLSGGICTISVGIISEIKNNECRAQTK